MVPCLFASSAARVGKAEKLRAEVEALKGELRAEKEEAGGVEEGVAWR